MDAPELERYREALVTLREELRTQLHDLGANPDEDTIEGVDFDFGFADSAQASAERDKVLALVDRLREQLRDVNHALDRQEQGTYGICERCNEAIGQERLEALPYSTLCVSCKQKERVAG